VVTGIAIDRVVASAAMNRIFAAAAEDVIGSAQTVQLVVEVRADDQVRAVVAGEAGIVGADNEFRAIEVIDEVGGGQFAEGSVLEEDFMVVFRNEQTQDGA